MPNELLLTIAEALAEEDDNSLMALSGFPAVLQHCQSTIVSQHRFTIIDVSPRATTWPIDSIPCAPSGPSKEDQEAELRAYNVPSSYTNFQ
jgi:hypothetical protein